MAELVASSLLHAGDHSLLERPKTDREIATAPAADSSNFSQESLPPHPSQQRNPEELSTKEETLQGPQETTEELKEERLLGPLLDPPIFSENSMSFQMLCLNESTEEPKKEEEETIPGSQFEPPIFSESSMCLKETTEEAKKEEKEEAETIPGSQSCHEQDAQHRDHHVGVQIQDLLRDHPLDVVQYSVCLHGIHGEGNSPFEPQIAFEVGGNSHYPGLTNRVEGAALGAGAFGTVLLGHSNVTSCEVALKVFPKEGNLESTSPCLEEVNNHVVLQHECVVPAISFEIHRNPGTNFLQGCLALKKMQTTLEAAMTPEREGVIPPLRSERKIQKYMRDVLKGLCHIHACGYYHNDIKPSNILIDEEGNALIGDLGSVTKQQGEMKHVPATTPAFTSEETIFSGWSPRAANDLWALGVVMLSLWEGKLPSMFHYEGQISYANASALIATLGFSEDARGFVDMLFRADTDASITAALLMNHPFITKA